VQLIDEDDVHRFMQLALNILIGFNGVMETLFEP
jgi:hypothetical protein